MKPYFLFDPVTGEYAGSYDAQENPLEPGEYIAPVNSTPKQPPATTANQVAIFSAAADAWSVESDYRGQTFYDQTTGAKVIVDVVGAVPANLSADPPASMLLEKSKADKTAEINAACATEIVGGFDSAALGSLHHYTATLEDQANLLGLIAIGLDGEFTCTDAAGVKARRLHTLAQLKQVLADGGAFKDLRLARARTLKDRIAAAPNADLPDAAAVDALKW